MIGLPYDERDCFDEILDFIEENKVKAAIVMTYTPTPGTALYDRGDWPEAKCQKDWIEVSKGVPVFWPKGMSREAF